MALSSQSCGVCDLRHITKAPIIWCTECDEGLCAECKEHHSLSKSSRSHCVIPFIEYQRLPTDFLKITEYCTKHDKEYQMYCKKHEFPCCSKCIVESHTDCKDLVDLDDVIQNVKTSNVMCEIEETLVEVAENLQKIRQHQQKNLTTLKESRKEIEKEVETTRIKINNHLDKLQQNLVKQLYAIEEKENSKICQLLTSLEIKEKEISECQMNIMNLKKHATDLRVLLSMKTIQEDIYRRNEFLQLLEEGKNFMHTFLSYKINPSIKNIMSDIISFGEARINSKSCDIVLIKKKAKHAQQIVPIAQSKSIENIKLAKFKTFSIQRKSVYGCCMLSDGRMAFTNYWNCKVIIFYMHGFKDFEVKMPCEAFDIVYISEDNSLAVTSGSSEKKCITIIDLDKNKIKKTIPLDSINYGIALNGSRLIYSGYDKGIRMINLHDYSLSEVVRDKMPIDCYTAIFRDNVYHTNNKANTVTCYDLQGEIQWTFQNESVLKTPRGIDVDIEGNVYVAGYLSNNVIVISSDGQQHKEILTASEGLSRPMSLFYSRPKNQLLVVDYHTKAHLFNVV